MRNWIENILLLWGWKRYALALFAGALSILAIPPIGFFPVLFITFPVFVWLIDGSAIAGSRSSLRTLLPVFAVGWCFGFGYFLAGLHWVGAAFLVEKDKFLLLMPLAVLALPAGLAVFTGVGAMLARLLWSPSPWRLISFSFALGFSEFLRATLFTGFPWNNFGLAFTMSAAQMQIAGLIGVHGLTLLGLFCAASPAVLADPYERGGARKAPFIIAIVLLAVQFGYGFSRLQHASIETVPNVRLRLVQPDLTQEERLKPAKREEIVERLLRLSAQEVKLKSGEINSQLPTHIIWPESALPFLYTSMPQVLSRIETMLQPGQALIAGLSRAEDAGAGAKQKNLFNSIYTFSHDGKVIDRYDKIHLVPFGEYLPFESYLEQWGLKPLAVLRGFASGLQRQLMVTPGAPPFLPLICYEIIFPNELIEGGDRPAWIVNLSDDSWFGRTLGPYQHLHQARLRAVEQGLPVVRATTTGISAVIDPYGRLLAGLPLGAQNIIDTGLPKALAPTRFAMNGANTTLYFFAIFGVLALLIKRNAAP